MKSILQEMGFELLTSRVTIQYVTLRYLCITYKYLKVLILCLHTAGPSFLLTIYLSSDKTKLSCCF